MAKSALKWAAVLLGLVVLASFLEGLDMLTRSVLVGFAFVFYNLHTMESAAARRHEEVIRRLDRLLGHGHLE